MADNITAPASGAVLATDDIGGIHYPRTKISIGADGSATDLSSANPMPVTGTVALDAPSLAALESVTVAGTVELGATSLAALETTELGATTLAALENITATVTGVATAAKQDELLAVMQNQSAATNWFAITPADTALATVPDAIYVGGAGAIVARGSNAVDATFTVTAGQILPIRPTQVRAASTATGIIGLVN